MDEVTVIIKDRTAPTVTDKLPWGLLRHLEV